MTTELTLPEYDSKSLYPYTKTLSSSQFLLYEKDPPAFYIEYVLGVRRTQNVKMLAGSAFSYLYQFRDFPITQFLVGKKVPSGSRLGGLFERVIKQLPVTPAEVVQVCEFKGWRFRATLDGYVYDQLTIIENKTGGATMAHPDGWTQERVNFDDQLTFQAWVHWHLVNVIPKRILLNWVDTRPSSKKALHQFKTTRSTKNLQNFERRVEAVIAGIEAENWTKKVYA